MDSAISVNNDRSIHRSSLLRSVLSNAAALLLGTALAIAGLEGGTRLMASALGVSSYMQYDPLVGWRATPNATKNHKSEEFDVTYVINEQGLRGTAFPQHKSTKSKRVVVLGDSNGFGWGLSEGRHFAAILEDEVPNLEVVNFSLSGYGTDQSYLRFVRDGQSLEPDLVILQVTPNDFEEIQYPFFNQKPKPQFVFTNDGNLQLTNVPVRSIGPRAEAFLSTSIPLPYREWLSWNSYAYSLLNEKYHAARRRLGSRPTAAQPLPIFSEQSFRLFNAIVLELNRRLHEQRAKGLLIHASKDLHEFRAMISPNMPIIDAYPALAEARAAGHEPWFRDGYHWNDLGHRLIADQLIKAINDSQ